jgi:hypothetical protein
VFHVIRETTHVSQGVSIIDWSFVLGILDLRSKGVKWDFARACLDRLARIFAEMSEDDQWKWIGTRIEMYGDEWSLVETLLAQLRRHRIFLTDVKPRDI